MSNRENEVGKTGFSLVAWGLAAIAICAIAVLLMPAHATTEVSAQSPVIHAAAREIGYLPAQIPNRGREFEPEVEMYY